MPPEGEQPAKSQVIPKGRLLEMATAPQWDEDLGSIDDYHWLFSTGALKVLRATLPNQREDGTWPAIDAWSAEGSSVHATCLVTLALLAARE